MSAGASEIGWSGFPESIALQNRWRSYQGASLRAPQFRGHAIRAQARHGAQRTPELNFRSRLDAYPLAANPADGSPVAPRVIISGQTAAVRYSQHRRAKVHVH